MRFFPDADVITGFHDALRANPEFDWQAALTACATHSPGPHDIDALVTEFFDLVDALELVSLSPSWILPMQMSADDRGLTPYAYLEYENRVLTRSTKKPFTQVPLTESDRDENPELAGRLLKALWEVLITRETASEMPATCPMAVYLGFTVGQNGERIGFRRSRDGRHRYYRPKGDRGSFATVNHEASA